MVKPTRKALSRLRTGIARCQLNGTIPPQKDSKMNLEPRRFRALIAAAAAGCLIIGAAPAATAQPPDHAGPFGQESIPDGLPQLESLDRGLVAVSTSEGVFVSWRLLASEVSGASETGHDRPGVPRLARRRAHLNGHRQHEPGGSRRRPRPRRTRSPRSSTASRARSALRSRPAPPATSACRSANLPMESPPRARRTPTPPTTRVWQTWTATEHTSSSSSGIRPTRRTSRRSATPARSFSTPTSSTARCSTGSRSA